MGVVVVFSDQLGKNTRALSFWEVMGVGDGPHTIAETVFELWKILLL